MHAFKSFPVVALACVAAFTAANVAADSRHADWRPAPVYEAECGSCHDAYPARLLGATDWGRILDDLDAHYDVDASLDDGATLQAIASTLGVATLGGPTARASRAPATLPRITAKAWFVDEHDEVPAATFRSPKVRSAANCSACHAGAARGDFDDDSVRIPR